MIRLALLVSGHGEVEAAPLLVRRIAHEVLYRYDVEILRPMRQPESSLLKRDGDALMRALARLSRGADAILVLVDHEDGAPCTDGPLLQRRCEEACPHLPVAAVLAYREFETWFLWDALNLFGQEPDFQPENRRDAKGWVKQRGLRGYNPAADCAGLTARMNLVHVKERSDSFRVFVDRIQRLLETDGADQPGG